MRLKMRTAAVLIGMALPLLGMAADMKQYIAARKRAGITAPIDSVALSQRTGTHTVEVRAVTRGSMIVDGATKILIEFSGISLCVTQPESQTWIAASNTAARLILRVSRSSEFAGWSAQVLYAVPETQMAEWELKNAPKPAPTRSAAGQQNAPSRLSAAPGAARGSNGRLTSMPRVSGSSGASQPPSAPSRFLKTTPEQWGIGEHPTVPAYTEFILGHSKKITPDEARAAATAIVAFSIEYKLDPRLIVALIICESNFNPASTSWAGAMGLGQIMPFTRDEMKVGDAYDIVSNIYCTVRHFRKYYDRYMTKDQNGNEKPNLVLTIAAYNAGPGNVAKHGGVPPFPKTQAFIQKVLDWYQMLSGEG